MLLMVEFPRMKVLFAHPAIDCRPLASLLAFVIDGVSHEQRYRLERCERGFFGANRVSPILE